MRFMDAHNHLQGTRKIPQNLSPPPQTPQQILQELETQSIGCAINSTSEKDWKTLVQLKKAHPSFVVIGYGIHPWWAQQQKPDWQNRLEEHVRADQAAFAGECGLDAYQARQGASLAEQILLCAPQLDLARTYQRPVVLHQVHAWNQLYPLLQARPGLSFALHRFKGNAEMIQQCLRLGGMLSIHKESLSHQPTRKALKQVPMDYLMIESDYDGPHSNTSIADDLQWILQELSSLLNKDHEVLREILLQNTWNFFRYSKSTMPR